MKVAFCIRKEFDTQVGGDSIQLLKTQEYLERNHDVTIDVFTDANELNEGYDIVHIFNLATRSETASFIKRAQSLRTKIALSTIFWDYSYQAAKDLAKLIGYNIFTVPGTMDLFLFADRLFANLINKPRVIAAPFKEFLRNCVNAADLLLPNSIEELTHLSKFAKLPFDELNAKTQVVVNATDAAAVGSNSNVFFERYKLPMNFVLQVGRIEYIKNQLGTLMALLDRPEIPIVFVGRSNDEAYFNIVRKKAYQRGNVFFIEQVPHADIPAFFQNARLHVLPSLRESPGLVNLEALINHCPIVVSDKRFLPFNTYFKGMATAVNPLSISSIRKGILHELAEKRDFQSIAEHIQNTFSWEQAAAQTYAGYKTLLP